MELNILFLTNKVPFPPKDGGSIATFGMIKAFADAGHKVTVLAMNTKKHHVTPFEIPENIQQLFTLHMVEVPALITIPDLIRNFLFSKLPYNAERFISNRYKKKLKQLLTNFNYDIVQLEGLYLTPYIPSIRKYNTAKIAYRRHNIEHEIWERTIMQAKGVKKLYLKTLAKRIKQFETNALNKYDYLIPITERDGLQLNKLGNTKPSFTIPAGFDMTDEPEHKGKQNLFFIGALDWAPNQEGLSWFLKECFPEICSKNPAVELFVAGRNAPEWLIKTLKATRQLNYLGEIESAEEFILENGIMIVPLLSGSGMRIKIIEGMRYKKAIVSTSIGCEGIGVENKEQIYIADNPSLFSKHCLSLLQNRKQVEKTGTKAYSFVKDNFNNKILISRLAAFYQENK